MNMNDAAPAIEDHAELARQFLKFGPITTRSLTPEERLLRLFMARVNKGPHAKGCWLWTGSQDKMGYGLLAVDRESLRATHVAFILFKGGALQKEKPLALHRCDNPPCVNPEHLFAGTIADNMKDCVEKGRQCRGERHTNAKLSDAKVREARVLYGFGVSGCAIARMYGVSDHLIYDVVNYKTWKHVT